MRTVRAVLTPFILLVAVIMGIATFARADECISDYLISQNHERHNLSLQQMDALRADAAAGEAQRGWERLAGYGDHYAVFAAKITHHSDSGHLDFFGRMLEVHWEVSNNREIFEKYGEAYAIQHFRQYVEILETGFWPDSDQIVNSYLVAARKFNLPEDTALIAVWMSSCMAGLVPWQDAIQLPKGRVVSHSKACMDIGMFQAAGVIFQDSTLIFLRSIGSIFE